MCHITIDFEFSFTDLNFVPSISRRINPQLLTMKTKAGQLAKEFSKPIVFIFKIALQESYTSTAVTRTHNESNASHLDSCLGITTIGIQLDILFAGPTRSCSKQPKPNWFLSMLEIGRIIDVPVL